MYNTIPDLITGYLTGTLTLSQFVQQFTPLLGEIKRGDAEAELAFEVQALYGEYAVRSMDEAQLRTKLLTLDPPELTISVGSGSLTSNMKSSTTCPSAW